MLWSTTAQTGQSGTYWGTSFNLIIAKIWYGWCLHREAVADRELEGVNRVDVTDPAGEFEQNFDDSFFEWQAKLDEEHGRLQVVDDRKLLLTKVRLSPCSHHTGPLSSRQYTPYLAKCHSNFPCRSPDSPQAK
jgi:hypothetical protein